MIQTLSKFAAALGFGLCLMPAPHAQAEGHQALPTLNLEEGESLARECAWAPHDRSVCAAREFCKTSARDHRCTKYCHVNPYDIVCGDLYRPHYHPSLPTGDTPYPWARDGGTFCEEHPYDIGCQDWDWSRD